MPPIVEDSDPDPYSNGFIPQDAYLPMNISELDIHIDKNKQLCCFREKKLYPRSIYVLLLSYSNHYRVTGFAANRYFQLLFTDFTAFDSYRTDHDDSRPEVYKKFKDSLNIKDDHLVLADCHINGFSRLKHSLRKFMSPPEELSQIPEIDLIPSGILLKIKCCAKCFRSKIELQKCFPVVLEKSDLIESLENGDKYLFDFLIRLDKKYPAKYKAVLEERYGLSKLLQKYNSKKSKHEDFVITNPNLLEKKTGTSSPHIPLMTERTQSSEVLTDINKNSKSILTDLLLPKSSSNDSNIIKPKSSLTKSNISRSVAVGTTLSRILNDSSLRGTFKLQDIVIIGYSGSPIVMKDTDGVLFINDELRILITSKDEPPAYVNGEKVYRKFLSLGFDQAGLCNFFGLSDGLQIDHDERYFVEIMNKLIGKKFDPKINKFSIGGPLDNDHEFWSFYGTTYLDILNV